MDIDNIKEEMATFILEYEGEPHTMLPLVMNAMDLAYHKGKLDAHTMLMDEANKILNDVTRKKS